MLTNEYSLRYWQGKGVFACKIHGDEFMEFKLAMLLGRGNSALRQLILEHERAGRDMGACRAELAAWQQFAGSSGMNETVVFTEMLDARRDDGHQRIWSGSPGWVLDVLSGCWVRSDNGH